jgi:hypothetical protein
MGTRRQHRKSHLTAAAAAVAIAAISILALAAAAACQEWPREFTTPEAQIVVYEPQVQSLEGDNLGATAAVTVKTASMDTPVFGAIWINGRISTDREARTVTMLDAQVSSAKFPEIAGSTAETLSAVLEREIPQWDLTFSLDGLAAALDAAKAETAVAGELDDSPPRIIFVTYPAVLVSIDGDPRLEQVENSGMEYVANTPFFIVKDSQIGKYYLKGGQYWYESQQVTSGWRVNNAVPAEVIDLAENTDLQAQAVDSTLIGSNVVPVVIVSTEPAELIVSNGDPEYATIEGTDLLYMTNTESDVIMDISSQKYFLLLGGRWYTSGDLTGGRWAYVAPGRLPADFARIPADSEMGDVLASVSGTEQAKDAVLDQQVPQTAEVDRNTASVNVAYDGDPVFEGIEGTDISYAVNAGDEVMLIGGRYYCCSHAVWFVSDYPAGPWSVCVAVPEDVYGIPPSCPVYNVKFVYVYGYTPDIVYMGYTPGYLWSFVHNGCVVYGTGYNYHGWYRHRYYPRPGTFGFGAHYNPFTGWGFSFGLCYGWLGVGWDRPFYWDWWGPAGYTYGYRHGFVRSRHHDYGERFFSNAHPGYRAPFYTPSARNFETANVYKHQPSGVLRTGEFLGMRPRPSTGRVVVTPPTPTREVRPKARTEVRPPSEPPKKVRGGRPAPGAPPARGSRAESVPETRAPQRQQPVPGSVPVQPSLSPNNVFAGKDGTIYRKTTQGWQTLAGDRWVPTVPSARPEVRQNYEVNRQELQRQYDTRERAAQKNAEFQTWQNRGQQAQPSAAQQKSKGGSGQRSSGRKQR